MANLFEFAADDKSLVWLQSLFGTMHGVLQSPEGGGGSLTILGTLFGTFNAVILAVAALVVVYIIIVGIISSAAEGEWMGKDWGSFLIPLRIVVGIAGLIPMGSGYCAIQIIMMWVIVQGIGAADTLWTTALNYTNFAGSVFTQGSIPASDVSFKLSVLFQNIVCDEAARATYANPFDGKKGAYYCSDGGSWCKSSTELKSNKSQYVMGPGGACGSISYCDVSKECKGDDAQSLSCLSCQAQIQSLNQIIPTFRDVAKAFIQADYSYRDFTANSYNVTNNPDWQFIYRYCSDNDIKDKKCCVPSVKDAESDTCKSDADSASDNFPRLNANTLSNTSKDAVIDLLWPYYMKPALGNANFMATSVSYYINNLEAAVVKYIAGLGPDELSGELKDAQNTGWILAGSYYYTVAEMNNKRFKNSVPEFDVQPAKVSSDSSNNMYFYRNNFDAADVLLTTSVNSATGKDLNSSDYGNASTDKVIGILNQGVSDMGTAVSGSITQDNTNPLARLQTAGRIILIIAEILFVIFFVAAILIAFLGGISIWELGTGAVNPAGPATIIMYFLLIPLFFLLLGVMVTVGGLIGIYAPLIPYIIFTFGAIGWLTSCIETMVAGPLVALGILTPSQHHKIMGKAEPGLMLLFNVFLRPSLMVFGFIAAILLASVVISMINMGFSLVKSMISNGDPLSMIIMLMAYVYLIIAALNKCFAAIHIIPENVMRWIGGKGESYGESEAVGEAKKGVESATSGANQYMKDTKKEAKSMQKKSDRHHAAGKSQKQGSNIGDADKE